MKKQRLKWYEWKGKPYAQPSWVTQVRYRDGFETGDNAPDWWFYDPIQWEQTGEDNDIVAYTKGEVIDDDSEG